MVCAVGGRQTVPAWPSHSSKISTRCCPCLLSLPPSLYTSLRVPGMACFVRKHAAASQRTHACTSVSGAGCLRASERLDRIVHTHEHKTICVQASDSDPAPRAPVRCLQPGQCVRHRHGSAAGVTACCAAVNVNVPSLQVREGCHQGRRQHRGGCARCCVLGGRLAHGAPVVCGAVVELEGGRRIGIHCTERPARCTR